MAAGGFRFASNFSNAGIGVHDPFGPTRKALFIQPIGLRRQLAQDWRRKWKELEQHESQQQDNRTREG